MTTKVDDDVQHLPGGTVRISMPADVANDLDRFKKGVTAFAERLGCPECFSGFDCTFESERDFLIDSDLNVKPTAVRTGQAVSRGAIKRDITVTLAHSAEYDLQSILKKIDIWGKHLGPHAGMALCCSGFDITFERELHSTLDANGNFAP